MLIFLIAKYNMCRKNLMGFFLTPILMYFDKFFQFQNNFYHSVKSRFEDSLLLFEK